MRLGFIVNCSPPHPAPSPPPQPPLGGEGSKSKLGGLCEGLLSTQREERDLGEGNPATKTKPINQSASMQPG